MSTIYLVSEGSYSDYGIVAALSTRELADRYVRERDEHAVQYLDSQEPPRSDYRVEEYEIDSEPQATWAGAFVAYIRENASGYTTWQDGVDPRKSAEVREPGYDGTRTFVGYGETREHARRSAEELRRVTLTEPAAVRNQEARAEIMKILGPSGFYVKINGSQ